LLLVLLVLSIVLLLVSEEVMLCDSGGSERNLRGCVSDVRSMQPRQSVEYFHLTLALNLHSFGNIFFRIRCWPTLLMSFFFFFFFFFASFVSLSTEQVHLYLFSFLLWPERCRGGPAIAMGESQFLWIRGGGSNSNSVVDRVIMNDSVQPVNWTHYAAPRHACFASTVEWRAALLNIYLERLIYMHEYSENMITASWKGQKWQLQESTS
jgi:hypothetical protein